MSFEIKKCILVNSDCYKTGRKITPKGIMVHSTGSNNPNLNRYLAPDDGIIGQNKYNNDWNRPGHNVCVHGFIGYGIDGNVYTYQTLPWNHRGWHGASGKNGSVNDTHISFEICEDNLKNQDYFDTIWCQATNLVAYLCKEYDLDPMEKGVVIGHYEGYKLGIASNHSDPGNWFPKFGESMDTFRAAVNKILTGGKVDPISKTEPIFQSKPTLKRGSAGPYVIEAQEKLIAHGFSLARYGADGDFGNETEAATKAFQGENILDIDGIIGPKTWEKLDVIPTPVSASSEPIEVGDIIYFLGGEQYNSSNSNQIATTDLKPGPAKITQIYKGKHPYHAIHTDYQSRVYGWINEEQIKK